MKKMKEWIIMSQFTSFNLGITRDLRLRTLLFRKRKIEYTVGKARITKQKVVAAKQCIEGFQEGNMILHQKGRRGIAHTLKRFSLSFRRLQSLHIYGKMPGILEMVIVHQC